MRKRERLADLCHDFVLDSLGSRHKDLANAIDELLRVLRYFRRVESSLFLEISEHDDFSGSAPAPFQSNVHAIENPSSELIFWFRQCMNSSFPKRLFVLCVTDVIEIP